MDNLILEYNRKFRRRHRFIKLIIVLDILVVTSCLIAFIYSAIHESELMNLFGILFLGIPVLSLAFFFVTAFKKDKLISKLKDDIKTGNFSANEIMIIGEKTNNNLFDLALSKRCEELGLDKIPQWCARDGVLPELPKS